MPNTDGPFVSIRREPGLEPEPVEFALGVVGTDTVELRVGDIVRAVKAYQLEINSTIRVTIPSAPEIDPADRTSYLGGRLRVDRERMVATFDDEPDPGTQHFAVLNKLLLNAGVVVLRQELMEVGGTPEFASNTGLLSIVIHNLRNWLGDQRGAIQTAYGRGYFFRRDNP